MRSRVDLSSRLVVITTFRFTDYGIYGLGTNAQGGGPTNESSWFRGYTPVLGDEYRIISNNAISLYFRGSAFEMRNR